jgi:hypothetical protein
MTRFLIEVPHENSKEACARAVRTFLATGSHFMTNADWGCPDDVHKAWFIVDVGSREEAAAILPPLLRRDATIIALQRYALQDFQEATEQHRD